MKSVLSLALLLAALWGGSLQTQAREVININRNWRFFSNSHTSDNATAVNLPHTWNRDAIGGHSYYYRGVGNYLKEIKIPEAWRGKRVFIRFGAGGTVASLVVNGRNVGEHRGGYTAFAFELTPYLRFGETNSIWVVVNNAPQMDVLPTAGDHNVYGGLYRNVDLIVTEPSLIRATEGGIRLVQKYVSTERAAVDATIRIDGQPNRNLLVNLAVTTPRLDTIFFQASRFRVPANGTGSITIPIELESPTLWEGVENPYLYNVIVKLTDQEFTCDSLSVPMGLRSISVDPQEGFKLNGRPMQLHGVVYYEDRANVGPALTAYQIKEDIDYMIEMGVNAVRTAPGPHSQAFYDECDRRGLIVWCDLPFVGPAYLTDRGYINTESFRANGRQQLHEMIAQYGNHPSIAMWGLFNDQNMRGDDPTSFIRELNAQARSEDPTRMTVGTSNQDGQMNFITQLIAWDHILGWKEGLPSDISIWLKQLQSNWSNLNSGLCYGAGASIYHQEDSLYRPDYMGNWHPERWQSYLHEQYYTFVKDAPYLWGVFIANMFDYGAADREWGDGTGVDDRGLITFDRKYRKDAFYFYKANWNPDEPFVYIAERRWHRRSKPEQTLKVYSNALEVELFVNGVSMGTRTGVNGVFTWDKIRLKEGINNIEARSDSGIDYTQIEIVEDKIHHGII